MAFLSAKLIGSRNSILIGNLIPSFSSLRLSTSSCQKTEIQNRPTSPAINKRTSTGEPTDVISNVKNLITSQENSRFFAVVHLCGKQYKVTSGDIILVEGYWPPTIGDRIRLEKVLLVGGNDFTLFGRPILESALVNVQATIIEKTLTHTKTHFKKKRRKQFLRINFQRSPNTMIRINSIELLGNLNDSKMDINTTKMF